MDAHSVEEAINELLKSYPGLKERITDENGNVREFLNIYVNEQDIRFMDNLQTKVKEGDVILLIPAIAGGA
ncbi:MAG: MoaD/ThiS family protein [candidate division WOR-3 bacterium]